MTGFGEAATQAEGVAYVVELRTVNNRFYKSHIRLPDMASFLENEVDQTLRDHIRRGTVNYSLRMKNVSGQAFFEINETGMQSYLSRLEGIAKASEMNCQVDLAGILSLPGIIQPVAPDEEMARQIRKTVLGLTGEALEKLVAMREQEGKSLATDLFKNCAVMTSTLAQVEQRSGVVMDEYHKKLKKRADGLLSGVGMGIDQETLAREVAIFADRCDIAEETTRLDSHLRQFVELCKGDSAAGRTLDFICQEMLREANTIASKASDAQISQWVIDIKCAIDRIKEQVQNIE